MQRAAYGTYIDGQVYFDEPTPKVDNAKVIVVFLEKEQKKPELMDIFKLYGAWEDDRSADEIISQIHESRTTRTDIQL